MADDQSADPEWGLKEDADRAADRAAADLDAAYADGRRDQLEDDRRLLTWAYSKLAPYSFSRQEDALAMDELKLMLGG